MRLAAPLATALLAVLLATGCDKARPYPAAPSGQGACTGCHGGLDNATGAPPRGLRGEVDNAGPFTQPGQNPLAVGAHSPHLVAGVGCEECHQVPTRVGDPGHLVGPAGAPDADPHAEVDMLHGRGAFGGAAPSWNPSSDRTTGTCGNVYCHGATRGSGGAATTPTWNAGHLPGPACGACHAFPPASHGAIDSSTCASCHPQTVTAGSPPAIIPNGAHIDGQVEVDYAAACTVCHGDALRSETVPLNAAAPPLDLGRQASSNQVGAHQAHLHDGPLARAMACAECHVVPASMTHAQGGQTKVAFATAPGTIAGNDGAAPGWTTATHTCSGVYCHGTTIGGGSNPSPSWTGGPAAVGIGGATATARCGTCHGFPPPAPHAQQGAGGPFASATECAACHPGTVDAGSGSILVSQGLHVNGTVEAAGSHAAGFADPAVHGPAALVSLDACRACHGATLDGAIGPSCTACHASAGHPTWKTECTFCHGNVNRASLGGFAPVGQPAVEVDRAAPPFGTQRETAATQPAVGAHQAHLDPAGLARSIGCQECHGTAIPSDETHANSTVAVGWGTLATAGGTAPTPAAFSTGWEASPTCTNYCHGATLLGGALRNPGWTSGPVASACTACHGDPMPYAAMSGGRGFHPPNASCGSCHIGYTTSVAQNATHVNGTVEAITLSCHSCHGDATSDAPGPGPDTTGGSAAARVGAHQAHTVGKTYSDGFGGNGSCGECHGFAPTSIGHANARTEIGWVGIVATAGTPTINGDGSSPTYITPGAAATCTNYCHGATLDGGAKTVVAWTDTTLACNACHAIPLPYTAAGGWHVQSSACGSCHTGYTSSQVSKATHVDGAPTVVALNCTTCHALGAPFSATTGATASTDNRVGAHNKHIAPAISSAFGCATCHGTLPGVTTHANGTVQISWSPLASTGTTPTPAAGTVATGSAVTCANYCHGATLGTLGTNRTPSWTATLSGCTTCHGSPGAGTHRISEHSGEACGECHNGVMGNLSSNTTITNTALHVNGSRDVLANPALGMTFTRSGTTWTCSNGCHGNGNSKNSNSW